MEASVRKVTESVEGHLCKQYYRQGQRRLYGTYKRQRKSSL